MNFVLNNVKNPVRTLKIAGPLGLGICAVLYLLANIAYFSAASKEEILKGGVTVASLFFGNVFGRQAQRALTVFVALRYVSRLVTCAAVYLWALQCLRVSCLRCGMWVPDIDFVLSAHRGIRNYTGYVLSKILRSIRTYILVIQNVITIVSGHLSSSRGTHDRLRYLQTFAASRVNQGMAGCLASFFRFVHSLNNVPELAKEGIPLPFGSRFWASNWPTGKSPLPGLIIHLIPSVSTYPKKS